jgi:16S rRNA (uracil1498-N3)-methyltransferase
MTRRYPNSPEPAGGTADRRRFFVTEPPTGSEIVLGGDAAYRISRVLRLAVNTRVRLFDGSGRSWPATILDVRGRQVRLAAGGPEEHPALCGTALLAGMIRPNRFEWLIEKATELGATAILPVICTHGAVRTAEIGDSRLERWRRIAIEAAEQCGRVTIPTLAPPTPLSQAVASVAGRLIIAAEPAHGIAPAFGSLISGAGGQPITVLTGPEGGLTADEIRAALGSGGEPASLGPLVLRAETAAIAALSILADARSRSLPEASQHAGEA